MAAYKLDINRVLKAMDQKDRNFYDTLTDDEKKNFPSPVTVRFLSNVVGIPDLENYYLAATNCYANVNWFTLGKHPKLQWLCLTTISPGFGVQKHKWQAASSKKDTVSKSAKNKKKLLLELFPAAKESDVDLLAELSSDEEIKNYCRNLGRED